MRRTLTILVAMAAVLAPAAAASADELPRPEKTNASCSNGKGGNAERTDMGYSGGGNSDRATTGRYACVMTADGTSAGGVDG